MNEPFDIIHTVRLTEKATLLSEKENKYVFQVSPRANKIQIKAALETLAQEEDRRRQHRQLRRQEQAREAPRCRPQAALEEGHRHLGRRREARLRLNLKLSADYADFRRFLQIGKETASPHCHSVFPLISAKICVICGPLPTSFFPYGSQDFPPVDAGQPLQAAPEVRRDHQAHAREVAARSPQADRWPQQQRPHHLAPLGGGHKQKYRVIDFKRKKHGVAAEVVGIEYDPIRTARIALLQYKDGEKTYILAPDGLKVGASLVSGPDAAPELGNALPLKAIPLGTSIHNVELTPGRGGQIARSAGQQVILNNREGGYALCKMPSGEIRRITRKRTRPSARSATSTT